MLDYLVAKNFLGVDFPFISHTTTSPFHSGKQFDLNWRGVREAEPPRFRPRPIRGIQGGSPPWLGRLGKVLLVRIVKNVVVVYSSANSLTPSIGRF